MTIARRIIAALVALAGLALAVGGAWLAVVLGPSGTARFSTTATGPLVIGPQVLGRVDVPVTVRASSSDGPVFIGAAPSHDVSDVVGGARVQQAVTAEFPARSLVLRATGSGDLADPRALDVWRGTGSGSLDLTVGVAPESVLVVPTTNAPVRVTVELQRGAWFLEAVLALVVGLIVAVAAAAWLVQQLGHRIPVGPLARRGPGAQQRPSRAVEPPPQGFDEDDGEQPAAGTTEPEPTAESEPATADPRATEVRP